MPPILNFIILHRPQQSGRLASDNGNIRRVPFTQRFTRKNCARNQKATERRTRIMYTHARNKTFKIKISVFKGTFTSQCPLILFHYYCNYARYIETFCKRQVSAMKRNGRKRGENSLSRFDDLCKPEEIKRPFRENRRGDGL